MAATVTFISESKFWLKILSSCTNTVSCRTVLRIYLSAFVCFDIFFKFRALFFKENVCWQILVLVGSIAQCGSGWKCERPAGLWGVVMRTKITYYCTDLCCNCATTIHHAQSATERCINIMFNLIRIFFGYLNTCHTQDQKRAWRKEDEDVCWGT